jgi:hypothetical protein
MAATAARLDRSVFSRMLWTWSLTVPSEITEDLDNLAVGVTGLAAVARAAREAIGR